jgi:glycosyltransferase involved in cell wall biosynthesis
LLYHHRLGSKDGQYVHVRRIVDALRAQGHAVELVEPGILAREGFGGESGLVARLKRRLPKAAYEVAELGYGVLAARRLLAAARVHRPDAIYERYNLHLPAGVIAARRRGVPLLLEVNAPLAHERAAHGGLGLPGMARASEARIWRAADAVLTVTEVQAGMIAAAGVPCSRIHVTPNGVDPERFAGLPPPEAAKAVQGLAGRRVVGFTGFVREWHGLDRVVAWLAAAAPPDVALYLVGDGPARAALAAQARAGGVADRLIVTGIVPHESIPERLAAMDVALQPDVVPYASPLKLMEYMAAGRAIVAPDRPNIREVVQDGESALLVEPEAVPGAIERLLADPALRARLGEGARRTIALRDLTWAGNARRIAAVAAALAGARAQGAGSSSAVRPVSR